MVHSAARPEKTRLGRGDGPAARQRLLGEAVRLFAQQGFARTSTRTIAQAAGVNRSAISYYFGDKEGLYRSAFYEPFAAHDVADAIAALQGPDVPLHEALQTYFNYILAPFGQGVQMQQCMRLHMREMLEPTGLWQKEIEDRIVGEACADLDARFDADKDFGLVVAHPHWHAGVIGIVASRIASRYNRPVVVIGMDDDGVGRGSCRSVPGFDLLSHLQQCSPMLRRYGGHAMAAGLEVDQARISEFAARFNEVCAATLSQVDQRRQLMVDAWIAPSDIGDPLYHDQNRLRPFGHSNPLPVWAIRNVTPLFPARVIGGKHLKLIFSLGGKQREAIGFGMGEREVPDGPLDIAFNLILNRFNGQEYLQLHLQDFRPAQAKD